jgi:hypothetical protein
VALGEPVLASTPPAIIDVGAVWLVAQLPTTSALLALRPDFPAIDVLSRRLGVTGLSLFAQYSSGDAAIWPLPASTTWLRKASVQGVPGVLQFGSNPQSG